MTRPALTSYREMRNFTQTPEPAGRTAVVRQGPLLFVVQKHAARRLHYDFRLEIDGVLTSWPIPKGPSYNPADKRLAIRTEDHPLEYATFEGVIPQGQYGGGQVLVWDAGLYGTEVDGRPCFDRAAAEPILRRGLEAGKLTLVLHGRKLRGAWTLVRKGGETWLLIKRDDATADRGRRVVTEDTSVFSGLTIAELEAGRRPEPVPLQVLIPTAADLDGAHRRGVPTTLAPMLPSLTPRAFSHPDWLFEPKLDGYRVLARIGQDGVRLVARRGGDVSRQYPWLVQELAGQALGEAVLDGEVVALDGQGRPSFQVLQNLASQDAATLLYYAFDLLWLDGYDLRKVPLEARRALLDGRLVPTGRVRPVEAFPEDGEAVYRASIASGLEGVVAKRRDSCYEASRRSSAWLKVKAVRSDEFVIGGYTRGTGRRARTFGALLLGAYDPKSRKLRYVGQVGSGFDERRLAELHRRLRPLHTAQSPFRTPPMRSRRWGTHRADEITWVRPEVVAEVKFADWTRDGLLRAPVFLRLREDKVPQDARASAVLEPTVGPVSPTGRCDVEGAPGDSALDAEVQHIVDQLLGPGARLVIEVGGQEVAFSTLDRVLWPAHGARRAITKRDLCTYFASVAPCLLPHLQDRPLTLVRFPGGIGGAHFYQRHPEHAPPFVETVRLETGGQSSAEYLLCNNLPTLLWLGQMANLELHTWYSRTTATGDGERLPRSLVGSSHTSQAPTLEYPDFVVFDLDPYLYSGRERPGEEPELHRDGFARTCEAALRLKELLDEVGLASFVKTSGRTGLHIYVPIERGLDYEATRAIAETMAHHLVQQHPRWVTAEWAVKRRRGKVFVDYNQNARGKTLASIYSPRALPWATVSMPLRWEELGQVYPTDFTILTVPERLRSTGDLWAGILQARRDLGALLDGAAA